MKKKTRSCLAAAGVTTACLLGGGCSKEKDNWANSPGTNGMLNLDAVKKAFQKSPMLDEFENRVNETFEGDNLVVFGSEKVSDGFTYTAREDLDKDKKSSSGDDTLFVLQVVSGVATLKGEGVNSYYKESWPYDPEVHAKKEEKDSTTRTPHSHHHCYHYHHWYGWGGYGWGGGYYTPVGRYGSMLSSRDTYRKTSAYRSQVKSNASFEQRAASKYGSGFRKSATKTSSARTSYVSKGLKSGSYKNSTGSSVRSSMGVKSSFSSARSRSSGSRGGSAGSRGGSSGSRGGGFRGSSGFGV